MNVVRTDIPGLLLLEPPVYGDAGGYFYQSWNAARYPPLRIGEEFSQAPSRSRGAARFGAPTASSRTRRESSSAS